MARKKHKPLQPTAYWLAQKDELLKPKKNLVTPLGHRSTDELLDALRGATGPQYPPGTTPEDKLAASGFVAQIKGVAIAGLNGYEITENWWLPPEGEA